jgi:hypothetical protein
MRTWLEIALIALAILIILGLAWAATAHEGFEDLTNGFGGGCCGNGDCGSVETKRENGILMAHIVPGGAPHWTTVNLPPEGIWLAVPTTPERWLPQEKNPVVGFVVCWHAGMGILCVIPGREG